MTALRSPAATAITKTNIETTASNVTALRRAEEGSLAYCNATAREQAPAQLRDLDALETMFAYFGTDELAA